MSVITPRDAVTRHFAQDLFGELAEDVEGHEVRVDLGDVRIASPSFLDELLRIGFEERHVASMHFLAVPLLGAASLDESAHDRGVADRVTIDRRGE